MEQRAPRERLDELARPFGEARRRLSCGSIAIDIEGLDDELCRALAERWGPFFETAGGQARRTARLLRAGPRGWLPAAEPGTFYRLEARGEGGSRVVVSHHFALAEESTPGTWRIGISEQSVEPLGRIVENALRFLTARAAIEEGGFAMHAAGVQREGRAYLFAGRSGSGKTTAVALAAPAATLGDDFGLVLPRGRDWLAPALPFDNSERVRHAPRGLVPVTGIYRLHQATATRIERPSGALAAASLMACVAFPWAMPDQGAALLERVERFVESGRYWHLFFTRDARLWDHLGP